MRKFVIPLILLWLGCPPTSATKTDASPEVSVDASTADATLEDASEDSANNTSDVPDSLPYEASDVCTLGEQALLKLECKDARGRLIGGPNLHGMSWAQICRQNKSNKVDMKPRCISLAKSCKEVQACR